VSVTRWHIAIEGLTLTPTDPRVPHGVATGKSPEGEWVRYDDHLAEVERLRAALSTREEGAGTLP
jgi:hypothetical protein